MADNVPGGLDLGALQKLPLSVKLCEKIIGGIQNVLYKGTVFNSFEPMRPAKRAMKENGQLMVTEIRYGTRFMNSYLDITYPNEDTTAKRPTVFYTHGGGFFGGSKTMGDPMAAGDDANFMFEDIVAAGYNFVNVDFYVEYRITDPMKYLYNSEDPVGILKLLCQSYIRDTVGLFPVDAVITTGKSEIQSAIKEKIAARLAKEDLGIALVNITMQDAEPPTAEVQNAFKAVETAKQQAETATNNANKYANEVLPAAQADADEVLQQAGVILVRIGLHMTEYRVHALDPHHIIVVVRYGAE